MWNRIKNKIIIRLMKTTHLNAGVYYTLIGKTPYAELENYITISKKYLTREVTTNENI